MERSLLSLGLGKPAASAAEEAGSSCLAEGGGSFRERGRIPQSSWESVRRLWLVSEGKRKEKSYRLLRNSEKWEDLLAEVLWEAVRGREDFFVLRF